MSSYLKKILLSLAVIVSFGSYATWNAAQAAQNTPLAATPTETPSAITPAPDTTVVAVTIPSPVRSQPTPTPVITLKPSPTPIAVVHGKYKNGTYTGSVVDAVYGNIQVEVLISDGKLSDVKFLQYPNDRRDSIEINQQAMPILRNEALRAQSAHVDGVSGATDTADAFVQSLSVALAKAS